MIHPPLLTTTTLMTTRKPMSRQQLSKKRRLLRRHQLSQTQSKIWIYRSHRSNLLHHKIRLKINKLRLKKIQLMTRKSSLVMSNKLRKLQALREISPRNLWSQLKPNLRSKRQTHSQKMRKMLSSKVMKKWPSLTKKLTEMMSKQKKFSLKFPLPMVFWLIKMT